MRRREELLKMNMMTLSIKMQNYSVRKIFLKEWSFIEEIKSELNKFETSYDTI